MFKYNDLYKLVFDRNIDADELIIISGYIGPGVIKELETLNYKTKIYVGMYGKNISPILHASLLKLNNLSKIDINYTKIFIHSKCYIWKKGTEIIKVLIGSANFSTNGLMTPKREVLGALSADTYDEMEVYIDLVNKESYPVVNYTSSNNNLNNEVFFDNGTHSISDYEVEISLFASKMGSKKNIIGVQTKPGDVHAAAGLNWGFSNGLPTPNDAYIKIPSDQIKSNPLMFSPKSKDSNEHIDVIWDDGTEMQMLFEGTQTIKDIEYPKQISTYKNKAELGIYLRTRIGEKINKNLVFPQKLSKKELLENNELYNDYLITKEILELYGRNSINIKLVGEKIYYFDFSSS